VKKLLVQFARYGPYHHARLRAAHEVMSPLSWEVVGLETAGTDATYAWDEVSAETSGPPVTTAFPGRHHEELTAKECRHVLYPLLDRLNPNAIAIAGWSSPDALTCLSWARKHDRRRILMSETRETDGHRVWWKELIKRYLLSRFDGALVGGKSHMDYLIKLGMPKEKISCGYDVVDNAYFASEAAKWRKQDSPNPSHITTESVGKSSSETQFKIQHSEFRIKNNSPYFLASNRFIERKNLARLIEAYAKYSNSKFNIQNSKLNPWPLVLLGDGDQKPELITQCRHLDLEVIESTPWEHFEQFKIQHSTFKIVYFPGFRQIDELPRFYAHAGCFIHPALEEPWGLVINEAMACGLPILSSSNVGAAETLVEDGMNGWTFDAENAEEMSELLSRVSAVDFPLSKFGAASNRILEQRCPTRAFGEGLRPVLGC